jgi:valyl-tRNA synthetase
MVKLHPERSKSTLLFVFESALRLLHPFMPFITEELWQNIPHKGQSIVVAPFPEFDAAAIEAAVESRMEMVQDVIEKVRNIRSEMKVDAKQSVTLRIAATDPDVKALLDESRDYIFKLAQVSQMERRSWMRAGITSSSSRRSARWKSFLSYPATNSRRKPWRRAARWRCRWPASSI